MFKPEKMSEVHLFVLSSDLKKITTLLYDLKLMHFFSIENKEFSKYDHTDISLLSKSLLEHRSAINFLTPYFQKDSKVELKEPIEKTREWMLRLDNSKRKILHLEDEERRERVLENLKITKKELENISAYKIGFLPKIKARTLKVLKEEGIPHKIYKGDKRIYFIARAKTLPFAYKEFYLPKDLSLNSAFKLKQEKEKLEKIEKSIRQLSNASLSHLKSEERRLTREIASNEIKSTFLKTSNLSVLSGHIPKKKTRFLENEIEKLLSDKYEIKISDAGDDAPTLINQPAPASSFIPLLEMYSLPKYKEIDPTFLMMLIFPIFYGFILGDAVYGLISLIVFTIMKVKLPNLKDFMTILQLSSVSSIIFGIIYGEFMGFEFQSAFYGWFPREHYPEQLLVYALLLGLAHINLALTLGALNYVKKPFYALTHYISWMILQGGVGILAWGILSGLSNITYIGAMIIILAIVLIYMGHGILGVIEIPSFFTNVFSYARLMAVGLSSIAIAMLINQYTIPLFSSGIIGITFGIIAFSIGHIFNIILGNFESFLHSLRLHYVEYFTKFYTGGGRKFTPFGEEK